MQAQEYLARVKAKNVRKAPVTGDVRTFFGLVKALGVQLLQLVQFGLVGVRLHISIDFI